MVEIEYNGINENKQYNTIIENVIDICFEIEKLKDKNMEMNVILTTQAQIRKINNEYRKIDKETDVLSFPMFEKDEIEKIIKERKCNSRSFRRYCNFYRTGQKTGNRIWA